MLAEPPSGPSLLSLHSLHSLLLLVYISSVLPYPSASLSVSIPVFLSSKSFLYYKLSENQVTDHS